MKYSDYIPLATTSTSASPRIQPPGKLQRSSHRRWAILGTGLVIVLVSLYFILPDSGDADLADDLYDDERDFIREYEAAYLPFEPPTQQPPLARLTPTQVLPDDCRDAYFSTGAPCSDPDIPAFDVVWTWVNGSDHLLQQAKLEAESRFSPDDPYRPKTSSTQARQYRCVATALASFPAQTWRQG